MVCGVHQSVFYKSNDRQHGSSGMNWFTLCLSSEAKKLLLFLVVDSLILQGLAHLKAVRFTFTNLTLLSSNLK